MYTQKSNDFMQHERYGHPEAQRVDDEPNLYIGKWLFSQTSIFKKNWLFGVPGINKYQPGDSKWPFSIFSPVVGGHQQPLKGSINHPKTVTSRIARNICISLPLLKDETGWNLQSFTPSVTTKICWTISNTTLSSQTFGPLKIWGHNP